jgi:antitoxin PrlF
MHKHADVKQTRKEWFASDMTMEYYFHFQCNTGMQMGNVLTVKGQVTIPKRVRDALGLKPGDEVEFEVGEKGAAFVRRADGKAPKRVPDGIARAVGSTAAAMKFLRGEDYEINGD